MFRFIFRTEKRAPFQFSNNLINEQRTKQLIATELFQMIENVYESLSEDCFRPSDFQYIWWEKEN